MRHHNVKGSAGVVSVEARITEQEAGGFTAVASTGSVDRDGEVIQPGALMPLPASIPVHLDHVISASNVVARARPYYSGPRLMIDATFDSGPLGQEARRKVAEGMVDSVSIVFLGEKWETVKGVRTLTKGELLACDLVSVPSQREARILTARSFDLASHAVTEARTDALVALAQAEIAEAKSLLRSTSHLVGPRRSGPTRRDVDAKIRSILSAPSNIRRSL
jgi:hypothetical protein